MATEMKFQPGFRISAMDVAVLLVAAVGSWFAAGINLWMGIAIAFVVAHFFLFCNVVRMGRSLELLWAVLFVLLAGTTVLTGLPGWISTFSVMLISTAVLVTLQMRQPSYHGILWLQINPGLPQWWEKRD
jgi:hypothetical protein